MENSLHYRLMVTQSVFRREILAEIARTCPDLLPGQPKVIDFLMDTPKAIQCDIARACMIEPPTLTHILSKMEASGLIQRSRNKANRRQVAVSLTSKGIQTGQKVRQAFLIVEARALQGIEKKEADLLTPLLRQLENNLAQEHDHAQD